MGYLHIDNLYKAMEVLLFKEVYALEKIHGTSAHVSWKMAGIKIHYFSGGEKHEGFVKLFDEARLRAGFEKVGHDVVIFGEAYGGGQQNMSETYGKVKKFIAFDVKIGDYWLGVEAAAKFAADLGLEFVHYVRIPATQEALDAERDADSVQAVRNGMGPGKKREGVVIRPPIEVRKNNSDRLIAKHKRDDFRERQTPSKDLNPDKLKVLEQAQAIAFEWVTPMRLQHVLDKLPRDVEGRYCLEQMGTVVQAMVDDVYREAKGEVVESKDAARAIGARTAGLFKAFLKSQSSSGAPVPVTEVNTSQA